MDYTINRRNNPTDDDILEDVKNIMQELGLSSITIKEYDTYGSFNSTTAIRKLGSWNTILKRLNVPYNNVFYDNEILLDNLKNVWLQKGAQPTRRDMDNKTWS